MSNVIKIPNITDGVGLKVFGNDIDGYLQAIHLPIWYKSDSFSVTTSDFGITEFTIQTNNAHTLLMYINFNPQDVTENEVPLTFNVKFILNNNAISNKIVNLLIPKVKVDESGDDIISCLLYIPITIVKNIPCPIDSVAFTIDAPIGVPGFTIDNYLTINSFLNSITCVAPSYEEYKFFNHVTIAYSGSSGETTAPA